MPIPTPFRHFAQFAGWRWAPSIALVFGSLVFVGLAIALIPNELGQLAPIPTARLARAQAAADQSPGVESTGVEEPPVAEPSEPTEQSDTIVFQGGIQRRHGLGIARSMLRPAAQQLAQELPVPGVDPDPAVTPPPPAYPAQSPPAAPIVSPPPMVAPPPSPETAPTAPLDHP